MKTGSKIMIILGFIEIIIGLSGFLVYGELLIGIFTLVGILGIIIGVYNNKGYFNRKCYMANFSVLALWGLILIYILLFKTNEYLMNTYFFYFQTGFVIIFMIMLGRGYIRRLRDVNRRKELDL
jgi:hypothetical protein